MIIEVIPEMALAAFNLYIYLKTTEAIKELKAEMKPIAELSQTAAEELFSAYLQLRDKDSATYEFMNSMPEYSRCDNNLWHGAIDAKIVSTRAIHDAMRRVSRYECGKKRDILRQGLTDYVINSTAPTVTALNYEDVLEDTYYIEKYKAIVASALGSPSSFIDDGFINSSKILAGIESIYQNEQEGAAAGFGVFGRRVIDKLTSTRGQAAQTTSFDNIKPTGPGPFARAAINTEAAITTPLVVDVLPASTPLETPAPNEVKIRTEPRGTERF